MPLLVTELERVARTGAVLGCKRTWAVLGCKRTGAGFTGAGSVSTTGVIFFYGTAGHFWVPLNFLRLWLVLLQLPLQLFRLLFLVASALFLLPYRYLAGLVPSFF